MGPRLSIVLSGRGSFCRLVASGARVHAYITSPNRPRRSFLLEEITNDIKLLGEKHQNVI